MREPLAGADLTKDLLDALRFLMRHFLQGLDRCGIRDLHRRDQRHHGDGFGMGADHMRLELVGDGDGEVCHLSGGLGGVQYGEQCPVTHDRLLSRPLFIVRTR